MSLLHPFLKKKLISIFIRFAWFKAACFLPRSSCLVFHNFTLESHNYSWDLMLIRGLGIERPVIKWALCVSCNPSMVSHWRETMCKTWFLQNCKGDSGRKESWREQPCPVLQVFSSPSLLLFLPHPSDLDMEECAPCLVSWGNRREEEELLWHSHLLFKPTNCAFFSFVSF